MAPGGPEEMARNDYGSRGPPPLYDSACGDRAGPSWGFGLLLCAGPSDTGREGGRANASSDREPVSAATDAERYSARHIERLLGIHEDASKTGRRHTTFLDIISWARDPGGDNSYLRLAYQRQAPDAWMARRGPLDPSSELAAVLWDFEMAVRRLRRQREERIRTGGRRRADEELSLQEHGVVALYLTGFDYREIASLLGFGTKKDPDARRVARILRGRVKKDDVGDTVVDEDGYPVRVGGAVNKITRAMNRDPEAGVA